jgi:hypothetical protein
MQRKAATDRSYLAQARKVVDHWLALTATGESVRLLDRDNKPVLATRESLAVMKSTLATTVRASAPPVVWPEVNGDDPNSFPVRGKPGSGRSFWQDMPLEVDGVLCDPTCTLEDRYTSRVRITPGPTSAAVSSTNLYSPNHGNFGNQHFEMWAICRGVICADTDTGQLPANSNDLIRCPDRHNNVVTIAITLWVFFKPIGSYVPDGAKTNDCRFPATGSICRF